MSNSSGSNSSGSNDGRSDGGSQGRGRPKKAEEDRRTISHGLYLSENEKEELEDRAEQAGMSINEFLRRRALGKPVTPEADKNLRGELGAIGNNINQIARRANQHRMEGLEEAARAEFQRLREVILELQQSD